MKPLFALLTVCCLSTAQAHMPWIYVSDDAYPRLYFGESLAERDYHVPDAIAAAEVWQDGIDAPAKRLMMEGIEEEGYTGLEGEDRIEPRGVVRTKVVYGNYHGSLLTYYAQHFPSENPEAWPAKTGLGEGIEASLRLVDGKLLVTVSLDEQPLTGVKASLSNEKGSGGAAAETSDEGVAVFEAASLVDGLNGVMVMHVNPKTGQHNGEPYKAATSILTATFNYDSEVANKVSSLPPVPEAVASFGAAVSDGWLYVYSGHIGQAHDHSRDNLSKHFRRLRLDGSGEWEELPMGRPLQGLPLVAHGGQLYRVGGMDARNASGEEEDMHSVDEFAVFNPQKMAWSDLPSLPGPRSSHNAVVIGDMLYVVGGWALSGDSDGNWQSGALAFDLSRPESTWQALPEPPFKRRALAVGHAGGKLVTLCGMTDENDLSKQVFFYDPEEGSWAEGPEFPGKAFHGFGLAAWNLDGTLYAGGMEGVLYRLSDDMAEWRKVSDFATRRFFHQLLPDGKGALLAVAGASPDVGRTASVERLAVNATAEPVEATGQTSEETDDSSDAESESQSVAVES
ncbi:MAG: hypothetical protein AAGJ46_03535 [Planctomycetota bacterium]